MTCVCEPSGHVLKSGNLIILVLMQHWLHKEEGVYHKSELNHLDGHFD